jgi:hypothetical protein
MSEVEHSFGEYLIWVIVFPTKTSDAFTALVYTQVLTLTPLIDFEQSIDAEVRNPEANYFLTLKLGNPQP